MTTPTPYKMIIAQPGTMHEIVNDKGEYVCSLLGNNSEAEKQANAAFVLTACNSHAALVEALEKFINDKANDYSQEIDHWVAIETMKHHARKALRMAQG